jgi:hypothetical protein
MMVFNLNIMAKAILCLVVLFCLLVMRSIQHAYPLPDDIDPDTMEPVKPITMPKQEEVKEKADHNDSVDLYLRLLIETDEELSKDPNVDQMSPSYNIQLNRRIAERLESLGKSETIQKDKI